MLTDWFKTESGLKQGDTLSPTLFNIFINDLANIVNSLNIGIDIGRFRISILLYEDDIVLLGESEQDLQKCLIVYITVVKNSKLNLLLENLI